MKYLMLFFFFLIVGNAKSQTLKICHDGDYIQLLNDDIEVDTYSYNFTGENGCNVGLAFKTRPKKKFTIGYHYYFLDYIHPRGAKVMDTCIAANQVSVYKNTRKSGYIIITNGSYDEQKWSMYCRKKDLRLALKLMAGLNFVKL